MGATKQSELLETSKRMAIILDSVLPLVRMYVQNEPEATDHAKKMCDLMAEDISRLSTLGFMVGKEAEIKEEKLKAEFKVMNTFRLFIEACKEQIETMEKLGQKNEEWDNFKRTILG